MSRYAALLRDLATGRVRDYQHRLRKFDELDWQRYGLLLAAAFRLAVDRRFRPGQDRAPIIRFVASVRERYDHTGYDVDPTLAEALVWAALDERRPVPMERRAVAVQTLLVVGLLTDDGLSRAELDEFLSTAEAISTLAPEPAPLPDPAPLVQTVSGQGEGVQAEHDGRGDEADQEAEPGVAGRGSDHEPGLAPDCEHEVSGEEGHRR